jgi:hypothetical protein
MVWLMIGIEILGLMLIEDYIKLLYSWSGL